MAPVASVGPPLPGRTFGWAGIGRDRHRAGRTGALTLDLNRTKARRAFLRDLAPFTALLARVLTGEGAVQLLVGLRPPSQIEAKVAALRSGPAERPGQDFPTEVRPLAAEIDTLPDSRAEEAERARRRAADLAHGLKTPLQALMGEARRLRERGDPAADGIDQIADGMRRHIDRELARARIGVARAPTPVDPLRILAAIVAVLRCTPEDAGIAWELPRSAPAKARIDGDDRTEALGARRENAARHARSKVAISLAMEGASLRIAPGR
ncbi:hypothetical protein [Pseudogemmobacter sonorensis]|uniref:hypothetical protein n=1 Tax=Pseudogemmobacter sonorensis TaxID=2989681 RepID=UPI0036AD8F83